MVYAAGIAITSLSPGAPVKVKTLSKDDNAFSHNFEGTMADDLPATFAQIVKSLPISLEELKGVMISVPTHFTDEERLSVKTAANGEGVPFWRILSQSRATLSSLAKVEGSTQNEIVIEIGPGYASSYLFTTEVDTGMCFPELQTQIILQDGNRDPESLFEKLVQPLLDGLQENPTEHGSHLHRMVIADSSIGDESTSQSLLRTINSKMEGKATEILFDSAILDHVADLALAFFDASSSTQFVCIFNVAPLRLGIAKSDGFVVTIIPRHNTIPTQGSAIFTTSKDNQTKATIRVMVGLAPRARDNVVATELVLDGISPRPKGATLIRVSATIDCEDVTIVSAEELGSDGHHLFGGARTSVEMPHMTGNQVMGAAEIEELHLKFEVMQPDDEAAEAENHWASEEAQGDLPV